MKIKHIFIATLLLSSSIFAVPRKGNCEIEKNVRKIYSFANHLFETKDYYRAITEYKRVIFLYPEHALAKESALKIGYSYKKGRKWKKAIRAFENVFTAYPDLNIGKEAAYQIGNTHYINKNYKSAITQFRKFNNLYTKDPITEKTIFKIGWSYIHLEDYQKASKELNSIPENSKYRKKATDLIIEINKIPDLPKKSPIIAGTLSAMLPGAGQLYTERYSDSFIAMVLNGLFIWGTVESVNNGSEVTAAILAFFEMGWYSGNIYNAVSNAHKHNRRKKRNFINRLKGLYRVAFIPGKKENKIALAFRF